MDKHIRNSILGALILFVSIVSLLTITYPTTGQQTDQKIRVDIGTYPIGLPVIVDGVIYAPTKTGRNVFYWEPGSVHTVKIVERVHYTAPGARVVFNQWNTGETSQQLTINVTNTISIIGLYQQQYFIEITSPYGTPTGSGWYPEGARVNISVEKIVSIEPGVRAVFEGWTTGVTPESPSNFIYAFTPTMVKAKWNLEYFVNLTSNVKASMSGGGWYPKGKVVRVNVQDKVSRDNYTQLRFSNWNIINGNVVLEKPENRQQLITVNGPITLEANYDTYYLVKVLSPYGSPPTPQYYKTGSEILVNLESPAQVSPGVRMVFEKWDTGSRALPLKIIVTKPMTLTAIWKKQYKLFIDTKVPATKGDGWYDENSKATISAAKTVASKFGSKYVFEGWQGDYKSLSSTGSLLMDSPKHVTAVWEKSYSGTYINITIAIIIILGFYYGYKRFMVPRISRKNEEIETPNE
ncbi:MAG: hypothetical protein F7B59_05785 [Desulfurococcales archaeon]|nr:hypothetical protein [Desulfurococcales archaeon]